ncbi:protein translocase subunit SecD [Candidatus Bipolaricaulota bacterium]|jgi:preprotein translocase subunit SecD|nr:protein translocase subunit SecD [Candidatus Bipolaricaulota bacterium]
MAHHHFTRSDWLRAGIVIAVAVAALFFVYPFWPLDEVVQLGLDLQGGVRMVLEPEGIAEMDEKTKNDVLDQIMAILGNRVNQYGLTNPEIRVFGGDRILVNLPGTTDPEDARRLIGQTAMLEFRRVIKAGESKLDELIPFSSSQEVLRNREGIPYIVDREVLLTGAALSSAKVGTSTSLQTAGRYYILMEFNQEGAQRFVTIMGRMDVNELLAIVLDGTIYSAPAISESIKTAAAQGWRNIVDTTTITGDFDEEEVKILAIALRAGALPVGINIAEETTVGPTLGADSIRRGMMTIAIGFVLILIYMFAFYRILGFVGNLALILNMLIVFAALNVFGAVLTLPGFAGIILTIGMTVDANVIIFERIKEERRTGKSPLAAVRSGFEKSLSTLFDANITTLITAFVLLLLGTGPVRGFAVTLGIGVLGSLFCALVVSRLLLEKTRFSSFIPVKVIQEQ